MAQHDLDIANQSAPNFRQDLNNALEALVTLSSGTTEPDDGSAPYANQLWYDTANNILKMRNEANDDWIDLFDLNQGASTSYPSAVPLVIDEDNFSSNSATRPPSQQSTKAYVDGLIDNISTYGAVGSHVFGLVEGTTVVAGSNYSGSSIRPGGIIDATKTTLADNTRNSGDDTAISVGSGSLSGTWRALGSVTDSPALSRLRMTLFVRIA